MTLFASRTLLPGSTSVGLAPRDLLGLDDALSERGATLVSGLFVDERPPGGLLGLVDWRTSGHLSRLCLDGWITGVDGERVLLPGRPRIGAERLVVLGLGFRSGFDGARFERAIASIVDLLIGLCPRRAVVELPGRHVGAIDPTQAMSGLASAIEARGDQFEVESLILVDDPAAHKVWTEARGKRR